MASRKTMVVVFIVTLLGGFVLSGGCRRAGDIPPPRFSGAPPAVDVSAFGKLKDVTAEVDSGGSLLVVHAVATEDLGAGYYPVTVELLDGAGTVLGSAAVMIVPDPLPEIGTNGAMSAGSKVRMSVPVSAVTKNAKKIVVKPSTAGPSGPMR